MRAHNRYALKERVPVCDRLACGEHVVLLRKGGLLDRRDGFQVERREFFLFPAAYHVDGAPPGERLELDLYAAVEEDRAVDDLSRLRRLEGMHALDWAAVEKRFHYGKAPGVHVLVLRAWRLARPAVVEDARAHDGCVSWVDLGRDFPVAPAAPALDDAAFEGRRAAVRAALDG